MERKKAENGKLDLALAIKRILVLALAFVLTIQFSTFSVSGIALALDDESTDEITTEESTEVDQTEVTETEVSIPPEETTVPEEVSDEQEEPVIDNEEILPSEDNEPVEEPSREEVIETEDAEGDPEPAPGDGSEETGDLIDISELYSILPIADTVYTGLFVCPEVVVGDGKNYLTEDVDFEVTYRNNVNPGVATAVVTGIGNYCGTLTVDFNILKMPQTVTVTETEVTKTFGDDPFVISAETDGDGTFEFVSSDENILTVDEEGKVVIVGAGTASISVYAVETDLYARSAAKKVNVTVQKKAQTVSVSKTSYTKTVGNAAFSLGATTSGDGTLKYSSSNTKVATVSTSGKVTVKTGGTVTISIYAAESANYKKSAVKKVTITVNKKTQTVTATTTYTKVVGNASFTLNAKTNGNGKLKYTSSNTAVATVTTAGKVVIKAPGKTVISVYAAETTTYKKSAVKKITVTVKPKATTLSSVTNPSNNKAKVTWKKGTGITGYQIQYSVKSDFSKAASVTVTGISTVSKTISNLTKGSTYYFRIRTFKTVSGTKYYSAWSAKKSVKISKGTTETLKAPSSCKFKDSDYKVFKIGWTKVEGATGYIVYYKKGEKGTWTKLGTTTSLTYTHKNVSTGTYYYYRVKAYKIKSDGSTIYGKYRETDYGNMWYNYPDCTVIYPDDYGSTQVFGYGIINNGKKTLRIYSNNSIVVDADYETYNSLLTLVDNETYEDVGYVDIGPGESKVILFRTKYGTDSWYDTGTRVYFKAKFDGVHYVFCICQNEGATYWEDPDYQ